MNKPSIKLKFTVESLYLCKNIVSNYLNCILNRTFVRQNFWTGPRILKALRFLKDSSAMDNTELNPDLPATGSLLQIKPRK